jgi:hypothetical protein
MRSSPALFDPNHLYTRPPVYKILYDGEKIDYTPAESQQAAGIPSSFGIDFVELVLSPELNGQPLTLEFYGTSGSAAKFDLQILLLKDIQNNGKSRPITPQTTSIGEAVSSNNNGSWAYTLPTIDTNVYDRIGLIITRLDNQESLDPLGEYHLIAHQ